MKKVLLTSLMAVFAVSSAQATDYFVGGSAGFELNNEHKNAAMIAPELGFKYDDKLDFGADVIFAYEKDEALSDKYTKDTYAYGAGVFARYEVAQFGGVKLLLKGRVGADFETYSSDDKKVDGETAISLNATINPMITYDISDSFTLYANLNFLGISAGYNFENKDLDQKSSWNIGGMANSDNVANTSDFQIGFLYNF